MVSMRVLDRKLLRDIWHLKGQALAIAAVMACGVAIVIMTFGAMRSLQQTRDIYYEQYRFADVFSQLKRAPLRIARQIADLPGVAAADPRIVRYAALDIEGLPRPAAALLVSLPEAGEPRLNRIVLQSGRLPVRGRDELLMGQSMASALGYAPGGKVAVLLGGRKRLFTIVGIALSPEFVYVQGPGQLMPDDKAFGILWLNRSVMEAAYDMDGSFNNISVQLELGASRPQLIRELDTILARFGGMSAYGREDQTSDAFITQELDQLKTIAFVIPPIFLGVAAFLIHMVLSRLIETERESIGLLKAFGYTDFEIGWHYLKFALVIAALGVFVGCVAGLWLGHWITGLYQNYFRFPFLSYQLDRTLIAVSILISLGAAVAGTWSAAIRAAHLAPAVAMSPPAPPIYRRTLIDRMGWTRYASIPTQMILRHIERWPLRAVLTSAGVAMAVMLLVGLFFFFDAIDELADSFYFRVNRQDVVIGLVDQRSARAGLEVRRLPGVLGAETVLEVAARISHGHLGQRLGITGQDRGASFRAFYDPEGRVFALSENGILLSNKLAELLAVQVGDRVEVEVLEGRRRKSLVPVSAIATEYVGLSAYMDRRALETLMGESGGVTSVKARVDSAAWAQFLHRLKGLPAVATVSTRSQAITTLRDTVAQSITIVVNFYIALGAIISFGVVYNAARIALSERGRELASLRVLGFTRWEAGHILLGELALLVVMALPIGCGMGYGLAWLMSWAMETELFRIPFVVTPYTFGIAMVISLLSATVSGLIVAWRINRLDLIAVLKTRE